MREWENAESKPLPLAELGERYRRYRLSDPAAEEAMARSLCRYGQLAPVTACRRDGRAELLDGFKRRIAAHQVSWPTLSVRVLEIDERSAKAAIFGLNSVGRRPNELEEVWIVQALVREDGVSQVDAAELMGRHKSWVCRRLALLERLCGEAQAELRLGLLSPGLARQLTRLSHQDFLHRLIADQAGQRRERSIARRIRQARFRELKPLSAFDWEFNRATIARSQIEELATAEFIRRRDNLVLVGQSGVGKTQPT